LIHENTNEKEKATKFNFKSTQYKKLKLEKKKDDSSQHEQVCQICNHVYKTKIIQEKANKTKGEV
jgi:hypothetical protein